jgi:protein-tyrosine phosphatase
MIKILFICHGNICRSTMAEQIMKHLVREAGREDEFVIDSAATSTEEIGNRIYPPAREELKRRGIDSGHHRARQLRKEDLREWDLLIGMETMNLGHMRRICGGDPTHKLRRLLDYTDEPRDIADPWFTGDFETAWADIHAGCAALLAALTEKQERAQKNS